MYTYSYLKDANVWSLFTEITSIHVSTSFFTILQWHVRSLNDYLINIPSLRLGWMHHGASLNDLHIYITWPFFYIYIYVRTFWLANHFTTVTNPSLDLLSVTLLTLCLVVVIYLALKKHYYSHVRLLNMKLATIRTSAWNMKPVHRIANKRQLAWTY